MEEKRVHVMVLTYPAQGHINPLYQFAKRLVSKGLKATLATTPYTTKYIHAGSVGVEPISDGFDQGGFAQAPSLEAYLESFKTVGRKTLTELILRFKESDSPVKCLVYDFLIPWGLDVARELGICSASFLTNCATVSALYLQIHTGVLSVPARNASISGLPLLEFSDLPGFISQPTPADDAYVAMMLEKWSTLEDDDWAFINTYNVLESELAEVMSGEWPLVMIGPMLPSAYLDQQNDEDTAYGSNLWNTNNSKYLQWLDTRPPHSVVYISFGTMAGVAPKQVEEISWGLEASEMNFLWVVKESDIEKLPTEFTNSIGEKGLVVTWCDQLKVLAHPAVGCFITHCGWNSTLEGLSLGVPMVCMPQIVEQPTNAKCVEDLWKVGVRAKKDEEGIVSREEIQRCLNEVVSGGKSEAFRRNAAKWSELARIAGSKGGSSDKEIDEFVQALIKGQRKKT